VDFLEPKKHGWKPHVPLPRASRVAADSHAPGTDLGTIAGAHSAKISCNVYRAAESVFAGIDPNFFVSRSLSTALI
jgi:hypothetical protein